MSNEELATALKGGAAFTNGPGTPVHVSWTNRHPIDELARVREEIKSLQAMEKELRVRILSNPDNLLGDEFEGKITLRAFHSLDVNKIKEHIAPEVLAPFMKTTESHYITIAPRELSEGDGE